MRTENIPSPHSIPRQPVRDLVEIWDTARMASFDARHGDGDLNPEVLYIQLAYGTRIAEEVTSGRWCVVADLIRAGAAGSWERLGTAMGMTATEAWDGFHGWITGQVNLYRRTGIGLTDAEANDLHALAAAVTW